jgi:hypothetical protein
MIPGFFLLELLWLVPLAAALFQHMGAGRRSVSKQIHRHLSFIPLIRTAAADLTAFALMIHYMLHPIEQEPFRQLDLP